MAYPDPSNVGNAPGAGPLRSGGVSVPDIAAGSLQGATNGTVNYCGYSGMWSVELERQFDAAFGR